MADASTLRRLAADVQNAIEAQAAGDLAAPQRIVNSIAKLQRAAEPVALGSVKRQLHVSKADKLPFETVENLCLITATEMGLISTLSDRRDVSLTAISLSETTGFDSDLIARVMKVLTASGLCDETGPQTYRANAATVFENEPGSIGCQIICNDMLYPIGLKIRECLRQHKPMSISNPVIPYDFATGEPFWATLRARPDWKKGFDDNMTYRQKLYSTPWHRKFPIEDKLGTTLTSATIVDIGGNQGVDLVRFLEHFPTFQGRLVLQDLPETLESLPGPLDKRIEPTAYDFFNPQPVKGADIYYLKSVLHDWNDNDSAKLMSNTAAVMLPTSRLLINEIVLADTGESAAQADMDMLMFLLLGGLERTLAKWKALLASVVPPLKVVGVWSVPGDQQSVLETMLA